MAKHRKYDLLDIIVQSINDSGWNVLYVGDISDHPFLLKIYNSDESYLVRIYIWNLTHGGGEMRPADEYRIQITGVDHFEQNAGEKTLILGWWNEVGVFAGFDFNKHNGALGASPSIQIREDALGDALLNGFAPSVKENEEIAIAFRPDFFVSYVENLGDLHAFGTSQSDLKVLEEVASNPLEVNAKVIEQATVPRQTVLLQVAKKVRDASFKARVLNAYGNACAFSGTQLKLVDAAHILPVSAEGSTDDTANGIAISALYHRAYDRGLITFNEKYEVLFNAQKLSVLKEIALDGGVDAFLGSLRPIINVPPATNDRPHVGYIAQANEMRGWSDDVSQRIH